MWQVGYMKLALWPRKRVLQLVGGQGPLYPEILQPIINKEAKLNKVELKKTYLYGLETKAGEDYIFLGK